jgi:hypothetical protein
VCFHKDTIDGIKAGEPAAHDDPAFMEWSRVDPTNFYGYWHCRRCDFKLSKKQAVILIDAALRAEYEDPDPDWLIEGVFADALKADPERG